MNLDMVSPAMRAVAERLESEYSYKAVQFQPWLAKSKEDIFLQSTFHRILKEKAGATHIGENVFISTEANVFTHAFYIDDDSWIAAGVIIRGNVEIGKNSSINSFSHIAGNVKIGNGVRIAGAVAIYGFNHGHERTDIPIYQQRHTSAGIVIGDGAWIGTNAVIVDGVKIGSHSIVAGGAVVTKDVGDFQIVGGNPAKVLRDRLASGNEPAAIGA
ncbi:acyltransferase [Lichenihabitans psoromatis]|uniref:acyltransferase n=1 Tax=Lichenihabitans psoromatis TaxID=2528642 RepID=UPI0010384FBB|nr:acyltransferase [Lichenihabitans psoromatis]